MDDSCNDYLTQPKSVETSYLKGYYIDFINKKNLKYVDADSNLKTDQSKISYVKIAISAANVIIDSPIDYPLVAFYVIDSGKLLINFF